MGAAKKGALKGALGWPGKGFKSDPGGPKKSPQKEPWGACECVLKGAQEAAPKGSEKWPQKDPQGKGAKKGP
jgi:hypothetical protein